MPPRLAFLLFAMCLGGCAVLPAPPAGPPLAAGDISYAVTVGVNAAPATATVVASDGTRYHLSGNGDMVVGKYDLLGALANPRFALRYGAGPRIDVGGYAGGWDAGASIRWFVNDAATASVPVALVAGGQVGYSLFFERQPLGRPWEARAAVELHPELRGYGSSLISFGGSYGRRRHGLLAPAAIVPPDADNGIPLTRTDFEITRNEVRLELSLGTVIGSRAKPDATFTVMPYVVLGASDTRGGCQCTGEPRLVGYEQVWGIAFVMGPLAIVDRAFDTAF